MELRVEQSPYKGAALAGTIDLGDLTVNRLGLSASICINSMRLIRMCRLWSRLEHFLIYSAQAKFAILAFRTSRLRSSRWRAPSHQSCRFRTCTICETGPATTCSPRASVLELLFFPGIPSEANAA